MPIISIEVLHFCTILENYTKRNNVSISQNFIYIVLGLVVNFNNFQNFPRNQVLDTYVVIATFLYLDAQDEDEKNSKKNRKIYFLSFLTNSKHDT